MQALLVPLLFLWLPGAEPVPPASPHSGPDVGFAGLEIYKTSDSAFGLVTGDWNGDGLADAAFVNRSRARVELLVRLPEGAPAYEPPDAGALEGNEVVYDGRFRRAFHSIDRRVWRILAADLDGDGIDELVYAEDGGRLTAIGLEGEDGRVALEAQPRILDRRVYDALRKGTRLMSAADLDGAGHDGLLVVGEGELLALRSARTHAPDGAAGPAAGSRFFGEPEILDYPGTGLGALHLVDLDGDGRDDLLAVHHEEGHPFRFRLRRADGGFGPRTDVDLPPIRSHALLDLDAEGAWGIACVLQVSGRIACLRPVAASVPSLARHALGRAGASARDDRTFTVGDLDGDGTDDLVAASSSASQLVLLMGQRGSSSARRVEAPSLAGVAHPRVGDIDGDGTAEVVVASGPERMIGVSTYTDGELPFPVTRAVEGEPAAIDVADVDGDGYADVIALATRGEGRRREYLLETWRGGPEGLAAAPEVVTAAGLKKIPAALRVADLSRDGLVDYLLYPNGANDQPVLLFGSADGPLADERGDDAPGLGILEGAGPARLQLADIDGDGQIELLAAVGSFGRAMYFTRENDERPRWQPHVLGQWPGPAADSSITGICSADIDGDGQAEIVLREGSTSEGLVLDGPSGSGSVRTRFEAGRMSFRHQAPADLDGDGAAEVVVFGESQIGAYFADRPGLEFEEVASFDGGEAKVFFDRLAGVDLDGDGRGEIVATERIEHELRLLSVRDGRLRPIVGFRVFEEKSFSGASNTREPRELANADFTGDSRADLAVLVHDKLILYPQQ